MKMVEMPHTKKDALEAIDTINSYLDMFDYAGIFVDNELDEIELAMSILEEYIKNVEE